MRKFGISVLALFLLVLCAGVPAQAAGYRRVTGDVEKNGAYHMWIDGQRRLHIRNRSGQEEFVTVDGCDGAVSDGKLVYYIRRSGSGSFVFRYSISAQSEETIAFLDGVSGIAGAYKNRLILDAALDWKDGAIGTLYSYNMNTGKMKRISSSCEYVGAYKRYFAFQGSTGAITSVKTGVYNAKTNKTKILAKKTWYTVQKGRQIYYLKEVGRTSSYTDRKLQVYRYTMTTGKSKALTNPLMVSVTGKSRLTGSKFIYRDENGKKRTIRF